MTYIPTFNADLSRRALNEIDAHPEQWNQRFYHGESACGSTHCWAGWCEKLLGKSAGYGHLVSKETINSIGLSKENYGQMTDCSNSRERLENLHLFFSTGVYGVDGRDSDGRDSEGFDKDGLDVDGWTKLP